MNQIGIHHRLPEITQITIRIHTDLLIFTINEIIYLSVLIRVICGESKPNNHEDTNHTIKKSGFH